MLERYIQEIEKATSLSDLNRISEKAWRSVAITDLDYEIIRSALREKYAQLNEGL